MDGPIENVMFLPLGTERDYANGIGSYCIFMMNGNFTSEKI